MPNTGIVLGQAMAAASQIVAEALDGAITGVAGAKGDPGGVDTPTAAVINEAQAALGVKEDAPIVQTFTGTGTWTKPANAIRVRVRAQAAGGGGGGGPAVAAGTTCSGGGGGGGGAAMEAEFFASELAGSVAVTVGTGGSGGAGGASAGAAGSTGNAGGNSSFGSYLTAGGGGGGGGGSASANSGGGGAGGLSQGGNGSTTGGFGGTGAATGGTGAPGALTPVGGASGAGCPSTATAQGGYASGGGGGGGGASGGGITSGNAMMAGAAGGRSPANPSTGGAAGATAGNGGTLAAGPARFPGAGGGGGGSNTAGAGGTGGAGQTYGGGGGGGGAARTGSTGGAGGKGGDGVVVVTTWCATPSSLSPVSTGGGVAAPVQTNAAVAAANYGSAKFPDFNGQFAGAYGLIAQPTTNFGTWFAGDGTLFMELEIPQERMLDSRSFLAFGNGMVGSNTVGLEFYGYSHPTSANRGMFHFYVGNGLGQSLSAWSPAIPQSVQRVLLYVVRIVNAVSLKVLDIDTGTLYAGSPVDATAFTGISTFANGAVQIGDARASNAERSSWSNVTSAWTGSIGRIGYGTLAASDATFAAIRGGADALVQLGASLSWYRVLDGGPSSLLRQIGAVGDSTPPAAAYGCTWRGGHLLPSADVQLARLADGLVFAAVPGEGFARVRLPFTVRNLGVTGDTVEIRVLDQAGATVLPWSPGAAVVSGQTSGTAEVTVPVSPAWLNVEARLRRAPAATNMAPGMIGVGAGCGLLGQSQIANGMGRCGLGMAYNGQTAASLTWTITSNSVTGQVVWRLDQGKPVSDMLAAACQQAARVYSGAQGWVVDAVGGTGLDQLINDGESTRLWTRWAGVVNAARGQLSTILLPWFTNLNSLAGGATPVSIGNQLDGGLRGRGPAASDHFLFEPGVLPGGGTVVVYPGSRHNATGTLTADASVSLYGNSRDAMRAWVAGQASAGNANFLVGPEQIVTLVDNYHPGNDATGDIRLGYSLGAGLGIGMGTYVLAEASVDPASFAFTSGARTAFNFSIATPGNGAICNFLGANWASGSDKGVMGVQVSTDGGTTWTYLAASACQITGRFQVTCTKASGSWPAGLKVQVMSGGPMAYGAGNTDSNVAAANYGLGDGDNRMLTGFGNPIRCSNSIYTVAG